MEALAIWEEPNFGGEVERDALLMEADPGSRLDIFVISGSLGSTNSASFSSFDFSSFSPLSSSVISMISFSFRFFAASRSFFKAALVGCKEGPSIYA